MLEKSLLERVRKVNQIILQSIEEDLNIKSASDALSGIIDASVFVINRDGKLFSEVFNRQLSCQRLRDYLTTEASLPPYYDLPTLLKSNESRINELYRFSICPLDDNKNSSCPHGDIYMMVVPIISGTESLGAVLLHRHKKPFEHNDLILAEIGSAIMGMILMRLEAERLEEEKWYRNMAGVAFESLSYSEVEAIEEIFKNLTNDENIVVASKIADNLGITRSVIVNALRKFESAGIIESRSLGMKGTYIRVKNPCALEEIANRSARLKESFNE